MERACLKLFVWMLGLAGFSAAFTGTVSSCSSIDDVGGGESVDEGTSGQEPESLDGSLVLDMVFGQDGTGSDASGSGISVKSLTAGNVMVYYNNVLEGYVPRFSNEPGTEVTTGYYRAEYYVDRGLRADLQDGFTLETMFLLDSDPGNVRMSVLSSEEHGGAGIYVGAKDISNEIAFDMYVGDAGAPRLVTLRSGVVPEAGKAYHVVAVWSSERSEASLYVDGEQKAVFGTSGGFVLPANVADQWFGIGCDAGPSASGQYPLKGDIYIARIYGEPAVASQAEMMWTAADKDIESSIVSVDGLMLFPVCGVCPGYRYMILGSGFRQGDRVKYGPGEDPMKPDAVVVNVWNYDPEWRVCWYENGVFKGEMIRFSGWDRNICRDVEERRDKEFKWKYIGAGKTSHLFYSIPSDPDAEITIEVTDRFGDIYRKTL